MHRQMRAHGGHWHKLGPTDTRNARFSTGFTYALIFFHHESRCNAEYVILTTESSDIVHAML